MKKTPHIYIVVFSVIIFSCISAFYTHSVAAQTLRIGSKGNAVSELQKFLSKYPNIYPEKLITGYFGAKTGVAVRRFQKLYGLKQTGIVDAKTNAKIKELLSHPKPKLPPAKPGAVSTPPASPSAPSSAPRTLSDDW